MKLNLGCGRKKMVGFINVDVREDVNPDVVDDISTLSKFEDNSVDIIYACHVLEHFGRHEYLNVLKRWTEVLKPGGRLRISVPDFKKVVDIYNVYELKTLHGFLYGGQGYEQNFHKICFDYDFLKEALEEFGYIHIKRYDWRETEHSDVDDFSQAYIPHMDKENGKLMSLNIEAMKSGPTFGVKPREDFNETDRSFGL